jgi:hypothetical protein
MNPILIVDGGPSDWLPTMNYILSNDVALPPGCNTVRIDGDLPTVQPIPDSWVDDSWKRAQERPLRVGDKVTLATVWKDSDDEWCQSSFATATVAEVYANYHGSNVSYITVTDVEAL